MLKKDKEKVLGEVWSEDRVKGFLDAQAPTGTDADFHALNTAYKSMRLENFTQFLGFFADAKRNFNATNDNGETVLQIINQHRRGTEYAQALQQYV